MKKTNKLLNRIIQCLVICISAALLGLEAAAEVVSPPQKLLHLSFEDAAWIEFSKSGSGVYVDYPNTVKGYKGNGASIAKTGEYGTIDAAENIDKARGSISFWYCPERLNFANEDYGLFSSGMWGRNNKNVMAIWLWNQSGGRLRFDVDSGVNCAVTASHWKVGEWVHIACTWDSSAGIQLYVNGKLSAEEKATWTPVKTKDIKIGIKTAEKERFLSTAAGVFDELVIYDRPLTPGEIMEDYKGSLNAVHASQTAPATVGNIENRPVFKLSFSNGFNAEAASEEPVPLKAEKVALAPGFRGEGAQFGAKNSWMEFKGAKNIPSGKGSVSLWMKLNWEPAGNGQTFSKVGNKAEGPEHSVFTAGSGGNKLEFVLSNFVRLKSSSSQLWFAGNRQIMKDTWHQYVFTWDSATGTARSYLDGKDLVMSVKFARFDKPFDKLVFGSPSVGIDGVLDEVSVYNYVLSREEVLARYYEETGFAVDLLDYAAFTAQDNPLRLKFINGGTATSEEVCELTVVNESRETVFRDSLPVSLAPGAQLITSTVFNPPAQGLYRVNLSVQGRQIKSFEMVAVDEGDLLQKKPQLAPGQLPNLRLIERIDCALAAGDDKYRDDGKVSVKQGLAGTYREAVQAQGSGFAYRIEPLKNPGRPHWLEIRYPDDKPRTFMVAVFQEKDGHVDAKGLDTMGIITGGDHPLTDKMQVKRLLFWPDSTNIMVGCYAYDRSYQNHGGPALAEISIYENDGLLPGRMTGDLTNIPRRSVGVWQEDPGMPTYAWFNQDTLHDDITLKNFWISKWARTIDYLDYSGQNLWNLMVTDYEGDTGLNSSQIATSPRLSRSGGVPGWADLGALMLDRKGVVFYASLNNRVVWKGQDASISKMIPEAYRRKAEGMREIIDGNSLLVDSIGANDYFTGTYNPLNPVVQKVYETQVRLYAEKFGRYKNFGGVHFLESSAAGLYFGNLEEGYDDYTIQRFEEESGIRVQTDPGTQRRFSARYEWLMANARNEWIQWRCKKIQEFYQRLASIIREYHPDAKLLISMRDFAGFDAVNKEWPLTEGKLADHWRGRGVDFDLYRKDSSIVLMQAITPHRGRVYPDKSDAAERYNGFNPEVSGLVASHAERSAFISYHSNLEFLPFQKQNIPSYWWKFGSWGGKVNGPIHAFATVVPSQEYVLEYLTDILAHNDAKRIIHGWWGSPDNGNIEEFTRFYGPYRSIPAYDFMNVPGAEDPVRVRFCNAGNRGYLYFVNQLPHPVPCTLQIESSMPLRSTLDGSECTVTKTKQGGQLKIVLEPYQVLCLTGDGTVTPVGFSCEVPATLKTEMEARIQTLHRKVEAFKGTAENTAKLKAILRKIAQALDEGRYAELSHLLQSAPIRQFDGM